MNPSFVYFLQHSVSGAVKIGFTTDLHKRIQDLTLEHGAPLRLLGYVGGTEETEGALHQKFREQHLWREWFHPHLDIIEYASANTLPLADVKPVIRDIFTESPVYAPVLEAIRKLSTGVIAGEVGCSSRTAENWRSGSTVPNAEYLITLMRAFDGVADAVIKSAGRKNAGLTFEQKAKLLEEIGEK